MGDTGVRLLGDVAVVRDGTVSQTSSSQSRTLLALLALRAGDGVDPDLLIDEVWGDELPDPPGPHCRSPFTAFAPGWATSP